MKIKDNASWTSRPGSTRVMEGKCIGHLRRQYPGGQAGLCKSNRKKDSFGEMGEDRGLPDDGLVVPEGTVRVLADGQWA